MSGNFDDLQFYWDNKPPRDALITRLRATNMKNLLSMFRREHLQQYFGTRYEGDCDTVTPSDYETPRYAMRWSTSDGGRYSIEVDISTDSDHPGDIRITGSHRVNRSWEKVYEGYASPVDEAGIAYQIDEAGRKLSALNTNYTGF